MQPAFLQVFNAPAAEKERVERFTKNEAELNAMGEAREAVQKMTLEEELEYIKNMETEELTTPAAIRLRLAFMRSEHLE